MDQNCAVFQHIKIRNNKIVAQIQLIPVNNIYKGNLFLSRVNSVNGQVCDSSRSLVPGVTSSQQVHLIAFDQNLRFSIHSSVQGIQLNTVGGRFLIKGVDVAEIIFFSTGFLVTLLSMVCFLEPFHLLGLCLCQWVYSCPVKRLISVVSVKIFFSYLCIVMKGPFADCLKFNKNFAFVDVVWGASCDLQQGRIQSNTRLFKLWSWFSFFSTMQISSI